MHISVTRELHETANANAVLATREIAEWLRQHPDQAPRTPAELADIIEAEFIRREPHMIAPLSESERSDQAKRCPCGGADDYCPCQNVPDRQTLRDREPPK